MTKQIYSTTAAVAILVFCLGVPSRAGVITSTILATSQTADFSGNYPLPSTGSTNIGDFTFAIPNGDMVLGATISGSFGNNFSSGITTITADSNYFVDGTAIEVATCDSPNVATNGLSLACDGGISITSPTTWTYTFTAANLATLAPLFAAGSVDFNYVQNYYGQVNTGNTTLSITITPEPATSIAITLGVAGIAVLRRRKV